MKIKGNVQQDNRTHMYCPECWSESILPYENEGKQFYRCDSCGYGNSRIIVIYPQLRYRILPDDELLHYSVGALVEWDRRFLLFHRRLFPFCYTIIAGHWDLDDSTPESAIVREVREESGIEIVPKEPEIVETLNEPCRRGADFHEWRLYKVNVNRNTVRMSEEADIIGWYSPDEIRKLDLTIPTEYFLKKLKVI